MAIPFGFGVGDFLAVSQLIYQIGAELKRNPESAADYQDLVIELQALDRAFKQLQLIQPTRHDFNRFNTIRALATTCQSPLETFLDKISKFEEILGPWNAKASRLRGFGRRLQWSTMYKDDVIELRAKLTPKVHTITILLLTQTTDSLNRAAIDRDSIARQVASKFAEQQRSLTGIDGRTVSILAQQTGLTNVQADLVSETQAQRQNISKLNLTANNILQQSQAHDVHLLSQDTKLLDLKTDTKTLEKYASSNLMATLATQKDSREVKNTANSILGLTINIMTIATAGITKLTTIVDLINRILGLTSALTTEMRQAVARLLQGFGEIQRQLAMIERMLPHQIDLPVVKFRDAFNEVRALPYDLSRQWTTFRLLVSVAFTGRQGLDRVKRGQYFITHARMGRRLNPAFWNGAVRPGDELSMTMILDDVEAENDICPFQSCRKSLLAVTSTDGVRECPNCYRLSSISSRFSPLELFRREKQQLRQDQLSIENAPLFKTTLKPDSSQKRFTYPDDMFVERSLEDIELYHSIQVIRNIPNIASDSNKRPFYRSLHILICEEHPVSRLVMQRLLEKLQCRTIMATDGFDALHVAVSELELDMIFMEHKLSNASGVKLSRVIRTTKSANTRTPIVCVTGYLGDLPGEHHFDTVIEKPINIAKLTEVLSKFCFWQPAPKPQ